MTPFSATLRSECTKLIALRATKLSIVLALVLGIGMSGLLAWIAGMTFESWDAAGRQEFEPIGVSLIGGLLSTIFFLVIGVKAATGEYAAGMIRLTLTATPRRDRVLAAKAIVVSVLMTACGLVLAVAMFLVAQAIFASYGMPAASLGDGDALRAVLGSAALSAQFPLIAMALGFVLRSTAGAVIGVFATLFAPAFLGGLLPAWFNEHVAIYTPGAASDAISIGHLEGAAAGLSPAVAAPVVAAWTIVFLGLAWLALERRDA